MPVMMPAAGAASVPFASWYMPLAASWENSRKGVPGSSSICTRSRGSSLPRATCFALAAAPAPAAMAATLARRSSTTVCMALTLDWKSSLRGLSLLSMCGIAGLCWSLLLRGETAVHVKPAQRAQGIGLAHEAAHLMEPVCPSAHLETGDEFDGVLFRLA